MLNLLKQGKNLKKFGPSMLETGPLSQGCRAGPPYTDRSPSTDRRRMENEDHRE